VNVLALLLCSKGQRLTAGAFGFLTLTQCAERPAERLGEGIKKESCYLLIEGLAAACEVSMTDLHQTRNPNPNAGIDTVGWLFAAFTAAIAAVAGLIAYEAIDAKPAIPVSQIVAR